MDDTNSTIYTLEVTTPDGNVHTPRLFVWDDGMWKMHDHEALLSEIGKDEYDNWLIDVWADIREIEGSIVRCRCGVKSASGHRCPDCGRLYRLRNGDKVKIKNPGTVLADELPEVW